MKRYEQFNKMFNKNDSAEMQSFEMIIAEIQETYGIEDDLSWWKLKHRGQVGWLNEEVKEGE